MQISQTITNGQDVPGQTTPVVPRKSGTIPVTLRLDPTRYERLKRLVRKLSITNQSLLQSALDNRMVILERQRQASTDVEGQINLFTPSASVRDVYRSPVQDSFGFARPEPTIALTYRAPVPMHRWLHQKSVESGRTIQDLIHEALKAAGGPG